MIVPMKKVAVIVQAKDNLSTLENLCALGVLHVQHQQSPKGMEISALQEKTALLNQALNILSGIKVGKKCPCLNKEASDGQLLGRHIVNLYKHKEQLTEYRITLSLRIKQYEEWGNFDPQDFSALAAKNVFAGLYRLSAKALQQLPDDITVKKFTAKGGITNCLLLSRRPIDIGIKEVPLPQMSLAAMLRRREEDSQLIDKIDQQLKEQLSYAASLNKILSGLERELEFQEALGGMGKTEALSYISGYIPFDSAENLIKRAKQEKWAIAITEPQDTDSVPTLIRNPRWISVVSPIFKFLDVFPEYREWDISPVFIFFFSLFFGMLIGDAGYGMVYLLLTFLIHKKTGRRTKDKSTFFLFYLLSSCAIIWGALTGTFFGQEWFLRAGYKPLLPALNNLSSIQEFCFFVGALHLSVAHIYRAVIKLPSVAALADIGWILVIWAVFLLAKMLILGSSFPAFGMWLIICGIVLVILFNNPQKNILKVLNIDLIILALGLISSFGEVVSYIRLFAVGMAGVAIADSFNAMAAGIGTANIGALLTSVFVVILGHLLCIVLGPLSVLVHGIRLNLLEFSGHANISWSGTAYKPLKE